MPSTRIYRLGSNQAAGLPRSAKNLHIDNHRLYLLKGEHQSAEFSHAETIEVPIDVP